MKKDGSFLLVIFVPSCTKEVVELYTFSHLKIIIILTKSILLLSDNFLISNKMF